jgi:Kef-type K+ transport system membrane component KefB
VRPALARLLADRFRPGEGVGLVVLAVLLAGALLTALAGSALGIRGFTGGLLFGFAVPQVPGLADAVAARLQQAVVVGIPVFLAASGLQTDLRLVRPEHLGALGLLLAAVAVATWGVGAAVGRATGMPAREAAALGVLVACGGLVTLVVALGGRELGIVTPSMQVVLALVAIATTLVTGPRAKLPPPRHRSWSASSAPTRDPAGRRGDRDGTERRQGRPPRQARSSRAAETCTTLPDSGRGRSSPARARRRSTVLRWV